MIKQTITTQKYLILSLGIFALIHPLFKIIGLIDLFPSNRFGSIFLTALISLVWFGVVVFKQVKYPVIVLASSGVVYALGAIILSAILSPILTGHLQGPLTNPFAFISIIIVNIVWGGIVGLLARLIIRVR